jgi:hypothetical protein
MWMTDYIRAIQKKLIEQYGFPEAGGLPQNVPDGDYPMEIDGKLDHVKIVNGKINCCRFNKPPSPSCPNSTASSIVDEYLKQHQGRMQ